MNKYTEEELMKKFKIKDFRKLNKKQFIEIVSKLDSLDPEVAIELIGKIPDLYKLFGTVTEGMIQTIQREIDSTDQITAKALTDIKETIEFLQKQMENPLLSENEYLAILNQVGKQNEMYERIHDKALAHKERVLDKVIHSLAAVAVIGASVIALSFSSNG